MRKLSESTKRRKLARRVNACIVGKEDEGNGKAYEKVTGTEEELLKQWEIWGERRPSFIEIHGH